MSVGEQNCISDKVALICIALLLTTPIISLHANAQTPAPDACAKLSGLFVQPKAIGLPTSGAVVMSAAQVAANAEGNPNGDYCAVKGVIIPVTAAAPNMEFQINLPANWNTKAVQLGGGGYDGVLITGLGPAGLQPATVANPLKQGFVTLGSDGGHKAEARLMARSA